MIDARSWAIEDFGGVDLGDERRTSRLIQIATSAACRSGGTVTGVITDDAERQAAYDFLESPHIKPEDLERGVGEIVGRRCADEHELFVVVDGTSLSFSDFKRKRGLGTIGNYRSDGVGIKVMSALALNPDGTPIGLLRQAMWCRPTSKPETSKPKWARPVTETETRHWIEVIKTSNARIRSHGDTKITFILDREGDVDAVIGAVLDVGQHVVVRCRDRLGEVDGESDRLRAHFDNERRLGKFEVEVKAQNGRRGRKARTAKLEIKAIEATLYLKVPTGGRREVRLFAVRAEEMGRPPKGEEGLEWLLLTNHPVENLSDARAIVTTYMFRWRIEEFHKTWKSGHCRVEESQLRSEEALRKWALIQAAVACRVERIKLLARATPDISADREFSETELHALVLLNRNARSRIKEDPDSMPTFAEATLWLAQLGGYTGTSSGGPPGSITLARGLMRLRTAADTIEALLAEEKMR